MARFKILGFDFKGKSKQEAQKRAGRFMKTRRGAGKIQKKGYTFYSIAVRELREALRNIP